MSELLGDVGRGEVRVHLRRVAQLELARRVRAHVADRVHIRPPRHLQVVVDDEGVAEAKVLGERRALQVARVREDAWAA